MKEGLELGAYRLVRRIGAGGMGEVWLAEHAALGRRAAIKVLHAELSRRPDIVGRFFNEARAATAISDPGIVQIFDFGTAADGSAYIVMELLEGESLEARLARRGRLSVADALRIMRQVATTTGIAHACGVVHRDLKPDNIFVVRDPEVDGGERAKLLDFGIAKLANGSSSVRTATSALMGTPTYMSPEQCRGAGSVDQRSDVYSLGCVLFALVAGRPPFVADGSGEVIAMHLREAAPLASTRTTGVPHALDEVIARCLAKDPADRFASAGELAAALRRIQPSQPPAVTAPPPAAEPVAPAATTLSSAAMPLPRIRGGRRWIPFAAAVAVVACVAVGLSLRSPGEPTAASTPAPPADTAPVAPDAAPEEPIVTLAGHELVHEREVVPVPKQAPPAPVPSSPPPEGPLDISKLPR
jgi:serine/threonine-protein kinase